jgi:NCS1 family nucleobase:cation symporter-1
MQVIQPDPLLSNPDIAPVPANQRNWKAISFFTLWVGMAVNIPSYMIAASLINGGMSWQQAMWTVLLGNLIVFVPMSLSGHAGTKYGIPFPVFARVSFGIKGAHIPSFLRAIVACGWFGIQTWIGGAAIYTILLILWPAAADAPTMMPDWVGVSLYQGADGFGPMLQAGSKFEEPAEFWNLFWPSLTAMVGFWATLTLNISDFTRYAESQRAQVVGQLSGLPSTMTLFAFIGVAVTSATIIIYGEAIWDPVVLVRRFESHTLVFFSMIAVIIATISTNAAANVVGPANAFSNMMPSKIDFKRGGYITGIIGILIMPWKLIADPGGYIFTWLIGYSALLGPVIGIILVDYFLIRKTELNIEDLYRHEGVYAGVNPVAIIALVIGVIPNIPGFLANVGLYSGTGFVVNLYNYAWFIGLGISSVVYYLLMRKHI